MMSSISRCTKVYEKKTTRNWTLLDNGMGEEEGGSQQEEERENTAGSVVVVVEGCLQPFNCLFLSIMFPPIVYPVSVVGGWG